MSGIINDNTDKQSGLIKTPVLGPSSGSSNPTVTTNPSAVGDRFINTTSGELFVATDVTTDENVWKGQLGTDVEPPKFYGGRGTFAGGTDAVSSFDIIDYITIASLGNAADFGDLVTAREMSSAGASNGSRGVMAGGGTSSNVMEYITFATTGDTTDFGNLTVGRHAGPGGTSNGTRGAFGGGTEASSPYHSNVIDYITIATTGDAADFGNLTVARNGGGAFNSDVRGCWFGGHLGSGSDVIDFVVLASLGDATDFGNMTAAAWGGIAGCSNTTRGLMAGGATPSYSDVIQYVTIASTGNASDFGDLTVARQGVNGLSDGTKGVFAGDYHDSVTDVMDYVNVASTGDASDFGNLTDNRYQVSGMSGD
jgi:hypothetical protein